MKKAQIDPAKRIKKFGLVFCLILLWIVYEIALVQSGVLADFSLPPRFPLLIIAPMILFFILFYRMQKNSVVIANIPPQWLIYFQSFRILVEIMLYYTFVQGILPESATFSGNNFDIVMGISAPLVALTLYRNLPKYRKLALAWNILGIVMILIVALTIATSIYFPELWGSNASLVSKKFVEFPYFLIACWIAPGAIFVHVVALVQLKQLSNKKNVV